MLRCLVIKTLLCYDSYYYGGGKGPKSYNGSWAPYGKINHVRGENVGAKRAPNPVLMDMKTFKGWFEENGLIGRDEYGSNMHSFY